MRLIHLISSLSLLISSVPAMAEHVAPNPITLAAIFAKTGEAKTSNRHSLVGVRFAVERINQAGGILGRPIELIELDNQSTPIGSKVAADAAVQRKVHGVIGAAWSSHSLAVAKVLQKAEIPMISPSSTTPELTQIGHYIFRVCFVDTIQGQVMAQFAHDVLTAETAAMLVNIRSDYSMGLATHFKYAFEQLGGQMLKEIEYQKKQQDFTPLLTQVAALNPKLLFLPTHDEIILILRQASELPNMPILLGGDGWPRIGFGPQSQGFFTDHWAEEINTPQSQAFVRAFQEWQTGQHWTERYHSINPATALSYDAVYLFADAVERAGHLTPQAIQQALAATQDFQGVTGVVQFDTNGDPLKPVVILQLQDGEVVYYDTVLPPAFSVKQSSPTPTLPAPVLSPNAHEN